MKKAIIAIGCTCTVVALVFLATRTAEPERFVPPVALERIDGSVLIGVRNTPDNRSHFWTYDFESGEFEVLGSTVRKEGRWKSPIPGATAKRLVWFQGTNDADGYFTGFDNFMLDADRKGPELLDFLLHPAGEGEVDGFVTALALVDHGRSLLAHEVYDDGSSKYRVWDLSSRSNSKSISVTAAYSPYWAQSATALGTGYVVVAEGGYRDGQQDRFWLVLLDTKAMQEVGRVAFSYVDLYNAFDAPKTGCVFIRIQGGDYGGAGYCRLTKDDFVGDIELEPEDITWLSGSAHNVSLVESVQFWTRHNALSDAYELKVVSETETGTEEATIRPQRPEDQDATLNYVVSEDASLVATTVAGDTFEVRSIALPDVTLIKRCRIEAEEKEDGGFELSLVEE